MELRKLEVVKMGRGTAQRWLEEFGYNRQRDINARQVEYYADLMNTGKWQPYSDLEVCYAPNGDGNEHGYLVNGQHRLYAVIEANAQIEFVIKHVVCESQEEIAERYGTEDTGRARSNADFARAIDLAHELGFKEYYIAQLTSAVTAIGNSFRSHSRFNLSVYQKFDLIREYKPEARLYATMTTGGLSGITRQMRRAYPLGMALATLKESSKVYGMDKIRDFWSGIAFDHDLQAGDPRKIANAHLDEVGVGASGLATRIRPEFTVRFLARCFNAFMEDKSLKVPTDFEYRSPIQILGTHFKGK